MVSRPLVYIESNFLLELVLNQEDAPACLDLLELAERGRIELVLPVYALVEPAETLRRRQAEMREFSEKLRAQLREMERMTHVTIERGTHTALAKKVLDALNDWHTRLGTHRERIARAARLLPLDWSTIERAQTIVQQGMLKREPDALMLAAVVMDLEVQRRPSLLINKNTKDFNPHELRSLLEPLGCQSIGTFRDGLGRLRSALLP